MERKRARRIEMDDKSDNERYTRWTMNAIMNDLRDERNEKLCMMIGRKVKRWKPILAKYKDISNRKSSRSQRKLLPRVPDRRKAQRPRVTDRRHEEEEKTWMRIDKWESKNREETMPRNSETRKEHHLQQLENVPTPTETPVVTAPPFKRLVKKKRAAPTSQLMNEIFKD